VGEAFARGLTSLPSGLSDDQATAWLYTVARNCLTSDFRGTSRLRSALSMVVIDRPVVMAADEDDTLVTVNEVRDILTQLSPDDADLLIARYVWNTPVREIADRRGITVESARVAISRARRRFRERHLMSRS